ncbi:hypothetical protein HanIR_Chr03g0129891 [Helianthus annuus]|nr:hypothetical protein HanIR_Chr03g0129891 [Helianthus annuus]
MCFGDVSVSRFKKPDHSLGWISLMQILEKSIKYPLLTLIQHHDYERNRATTSRHYIKHLVSQIYPKQI